MLWKRYDQLVYTTTIKAGYNANGITVAGGNGEGSGNDQISPSYIFVDSVGNIYVSDVLNDRVQKWIPGATEGITVAGGNGEGSAANQLNHPGGLYTDAQGNVYVADIFNDRIQKWPSGAMEGITIAGGNGHGSAPNQLAGPSGIFVKGNAIYIADAVNNRIQKWTFGATEGITVAGGHGSGFAANQLRSPSFLFIDTDGNIYISDNGNNRVQKWMSGASTGITVAGGNGEGSSSNQFHSPEGILIDNLNNIFVSDFFNERVQKWVPGATKGITVAGGNGAGSDSNQFIGPYGLGFDISGNLYVADFQNRRVQMFITDSSNSGIDTTYTPTEGGTYTVVAVFKNGCIDTSQPVKIKALPHVYHISGQKRSLCGGGDFVYSIKPFDDINTTYNWSIPARTTLLSGQGTAVVNVRIPSGFASGALSITAQNSCGSGPIFTDTLSTKPVRPDPITGPGIVGYHDTAVYSSGSEVEGITYQWQVPQGVAILSGQGTASITVQWNRPLHGTVRVFTSLCNEEASAQDLKVILGNPKTQNKSSYVTSQKAGEPTPSVLYPNPSNSTVSLHFAANQQGKYSITITNETGQAIMQREQLFTKGYNTLSFNISSYAKGIYFITLASEQNIRQTYTLVKE